METTLDDEIEARLNMAISRAHRSLTADELARVRERITRDLGNRAEMRTLPLANGDAPDPGFNPRMSLDGGGPW